MYCVSLFEDWITGNNESSHAPYLPAICIFICSSLSLLSSDSSLRFNQHMSWIMVWFFTLKSAVGIFNFFSFSNALVFSGREKIDISEKPNARKIFNYKITF